MKKELTEMQLRCLQHIADGMSAKQSAREVNKTENCMNQVSAKLKAKLGAETLAHAVAIGLRKRLIK